MKVFRSFTRQSAELQRKRVQCKWRNVQSQKLVYGVLEKYTIRNTTPLWGTVERPPLVTSFVSTGEESARPYVVPLIAFFVWCNASATPSWWFNSVTTYSRRRENKAPGERRSRCRSSYLEASEIWFISLWPFCSCCIGKHIQTKPIWPTRTGLEPGAFEGVINFVPRFKYYELLMSE